MYNMIPQVPKDVSEQYMTGTALSGAYQTSALSGREGAERKATPGQADGYTLMTAAGAFDAAAMGRLMDRISDNTSDFQTGSTGVIAAISQVLAAPGSASFDINAGGRGDSQIYLIRQSADGKVSIARPIEAIPDSQFFVTEFGELGMPGANNIAATSRVTLNAGEKLFVVAATDGLSDAYLGKPGQMEKDIEAYLKANPQSADIARFLSVRAAALGSEDNITVVATRLDSATDLKGSSIVAAAFDGVGKGTENDTGLKSSAALSRSLAAAVQRDLEGGQKPVLVARRELEHIASRTAELARGATPGAKDPDVAQVSKSIMTLQTSKMLRESAQRLHIAPATPAAPAPGMASSAPKSPRL